MPIELKPYILLRATFTHYYHHRECGNTVSSLFKLVPMWNNALDKWKSYRSCGFAAALIQGAVRTGGALDRMLEMQAKQLAAGGPKDGEMEYDDSFIYDNVSQSHCFLTYNCAEVRAARALKNFSRAAPCKAALPLTVLRAITIGHYSSDHSGQACLLANTRESIVIVAISRAVGVLFKTTFTLAQVVLPIKVAAVILSFEFLA